VPASNNSCAFEHKQQPLLGDDGLGQPLSNSQSISHKRFESGMPASYKTIFPSSCLSLGGACQCVRVHHVGMLLASDVMGTGHHGQTAVSAQQPPSRPNCTAGVWRHAAARSLCLCVSFDRQPSLSMPAPAVIVKSHPCHAMALAAQILTWTGRTSSSTWCASTAVLAGNRSVAAFMRFAVVTVECSDLLHLSPQHHLPCLAKGP